MPDTPSHAPSLFRQISTMLWLVVLLFAALNATIVVALYAGDQAQLARDVVRLQAERLAKSDSPRTIDAPDDSRWRWEIRDASGALVAAGGDPDLTIPAMIGHAEVILFESWERGVRFGGVARADRGHRPVWVAMTIRSESHRTFGEAIRRELMEHVALPLAPLALLLLAFSVWEVRRLVRPLRIAAREADALDPAKLDARLTVPGAPLEAETLVRAMNRALGRIESGIRFIREFNANAAHELRTPLAIMNLSIERLPPGETADRLREDVAGMSRVVSQMLDLAQADSMNPAAVAEVDLSALAGQLVAQMAPMAWATGREIRLDAEGAPVVPGHAEAISRALRNLIENALRHTAPGTTVEVTVGPTRKIAVGDHGPGVPDPQKSLVFERFWRADRSRSDGAGLGLGIVQSTMLAHGGEVRVEDAPGGGAVFVLDFETEKA